MRDGVGWDLGDDRVFKAYFGKRISETGFWTQRGVEEKRRSRDDLLRAPLGWCRSQESVACGPHPVWHRICTAHELKVVFTC